MTECNPGGKVAFWGYLLVPKIGVRSPRRRDDDWPDSPSRIAQGLQSPGVFEFKQQDLRG